jgi:hypothetical protein
MSPRQQHRSPRDGSLGPHHQKRWQAIVSGGKTPGEPPTNQSRRRLFNVNPTKPDGIRLVVSKTAGSFAFCEIRLYNEMQKDAYDERY